MATAEQCRAALERLTGRLAQLDAESRRAHLMNRTLSCHISDLAVTFLTRLGPHGADPIVQAADGFPPAQIRFTARSDDVVSIADDPGSFGRAWLTGRLRVECTIFDLFQLRKLLLSRTAIGGNQRPAWDA